MEQIVQSLLRSFIDDHLKEECVQTEIDDVLVHYVAGILESVATGENADEFDVEEFADVMSAYLPGFDSVDRAVVYEWIFSAASSVTNQSTSEPLSDSVTPTGASVSSEPCVENSCSVANDEDKPPVHISDTEKAAAPESCHGSTVAEELPINSLSLTGKAETHRRRSKQNKKSKLKSSSSSGAGPEENKSSVRTHDGPTEDENASMLQDMFPNVALEVIHRALLGTDGVLEQTISILLEQQSEQVNLTRQQTEAEPKHGPVMSKSPPGRSETSTPAKPLASKDNAQDQARIKDFVLGKYLLVDEAEDERQHRPHLQLAPKTKQRTMYRDNHVVGTKGERYSMVSKKDQEDDDMKKTYVSLKPLRKYRFH